VAAHEAVRASGRGRRLVVAGLVVAVVLALRAFVAEPFAIPSASMEPTLRPGDHVLVDKLAYRRGEPRRGDVAVFGAPDGSSDVLLKRIVAIPGDTVAMEDGVLFVNRRSRREPYVDYSRVDSVYFGPVTVPRDGVFVLGDNRAESQDSRDYGPVPRRSLIGRVRARVWPLTR
jgi:signal peptidase I